jgi:hypothetical protein
VSYWIKLGARVLIKHQIRRAESVAYGLTNSTQSPPPQKKKKIDTHFSLISSNAQEFFAAYEPVSIKSRLSSSSAEVNKLTLVKDRHTVSTEAQTVLQTAKCH